MLRKTQLLLTLTSLALTAGCASTSQNNMANESTVLPGTTHYTMVNFRPGTKELSKEEQSKIKQLTDVAERHGNINEVRILAWADREYPSQGQNVPERDSKLADERASTVKNLLKKDLQAEVTIDSHNMAQRPNMYSEIIQNQDYEIKTTFENTGATPAGTHSPGASSGLSAAKASRALVLITYNTATPNKGELHE